MQALKELDENGLDVEELQRKCRQVGVGVDGSKDEHVYVCMCACMYVCMHVCVYEYIYL